MILAYRYLAGLCLAGQPAFSAFIGYYPYLGSLDAWWGDDRWCRGLAEFRGDWAPGSEVPQSFSQLYIVANGVEVGTARGVLLPDAPAPPIKTEGGGWSRFVVFARWRAYVLLPTLFEVDDGFVIRASPALKLAFFLRGKPFYYTAPSWKIASLLPTDRAPGSGSLVGEVFRVVESDADYLRLVGRGGDVYLAWDFVLGTLDSGEWVLLGEDGLYLAERRGEEVVVKEPYHGSIFDVRGPPYAPYYPVVPVKWVRKKLREVARLAGTRVKIGKAPVDAAYLLRWPLVEYSVVENLQIERRVSDWRGWYPIYIWEF